MPDEMKCRKCQEENFCMEKNIDMKFFIDNAIPVTGLEGL
jgi:hypothetical protein